MKYKYLTWVFIVMISFGLLWGCATPYPAGIAYTKLKLPVNVTSNPSASAKVDMHKQILTICPLPYLHQLTAAKEINPSPCSPLHGHQE